MLQLRETRIVRSEHLPVLATAQFPEEGIFAAYDKDATGNTVIRPCGSGDVSVCAGVTISRNVPPAFVPNYEASIVPPSLTYTLARVPIAGQLLVLVNGVKKTIAGEAPASAAAVQLVGNNITFFAGEAAKTLDVQYLYTPTVIEARSLIGDAPAGGLASTALGVIGVVKQASISTNFFDASADWTNVMYVALAANGTVTPGTLGTHEPGIVVMRAPAAANPFLGLSINLT
jgi:hypothetical protein